MIYNIYATSTKSNAMAALMPSFVIFLLLLLPSMAAADPQTHLVVRVCGPVDAGDPTSYFTALNSTFPNLLSDLSSTFYASAQASSYEPVFSLFQCREYLSAADCLACFNAAASLIGSCYPRKSGFAVYDGCTIGYRSSSRSFDGTTNSAGPPSSFCEDGMDGAAGFSSKVAAAVEGLVGEVPKRRTMFGAAKVGGEVYAVGQCLLAESVGSDGCRSCLKLAYDNMKGCLPAVGGRSVNLECFLRYSDRPFFNESKVILVDTPGLLDSLFDLFIFVVF